MRNLLNDKKPRRIKKNSCIILFDIKHTRPYFYENATRPPFVSYETRIIDIKIARLHCRDTFLSNYDNFYLKEGVVYPSCNDFPYRISSNCNLHMYRTNSLCSLCVSNNTTTHGVSKTRTPPTQNIRQIMLRAVANFIKFIGNLEILQTLS